MTDLPEFLDFFGADRANHGLLPAIAVSLLLHFGAIAALIALSTPSRQPPLPPAIEVSLASMPQTKGGKKTKAPVARTSQQTTKKKKTDTRKQASQPQKASPRQVGLKKESQEKSRPRSEPEPETATASTPDTSSHRNLGGTGGVEDSGVSFTLGGNSQQINTQDVEFSDYFRILLDEVGRRWTRGYMTGGTTTITFTIHRDGHTSNVDVTRSSGQAFLDGPAKRAVLGARFPPLPQGFRDDKLIVSINFPYGKP